LLDDAGDEIADVAELVAIGLDKKMLPSCAASTFRVLACATESSAEQAAYMPPAPKASATAIQAKFVLFMSASPYAGTIPSTYSLPPHRRQMEQMKDAAARTAISNAKLTWRC
jgi:hypothetical protein